MFVLTHVWRRNIALAGFPLTGSGFRNVSSLGSIPEDSFSFHACSAWDSRNMFA